MRPERWRLFVAVPVGDELRRGLAAAVDEWKKRPDLAGLRWTDPESWHVTLAFLGLKHPDEVARITEVMGRIGSRHAPLSLATHGLGGFPSIARARAVWYGVEDHTRTLGHMASELRRELGIDSGQPFRPHVTIARARGATGVDLRQWVNGVSPVGEISIETLALLRSHTARRLARYEVVHEARVGEPPASRAGSIRT